ncbi:MAG: hypothetical protein PWQ88_1252 [Candidatus Methanomethylophilaceae archaeon]|nr:hypothetical protein [Candidatus Methanomethylophilaceae archaeon]MDI3541183.1 hypothetical protein [Candidatus Methanomethylophilaceae archaeon]HIJ00934.1 MBL fold metallo-hydrolase [Candidatus Methanomethylophilaceae archaeon]
MIEVHVLASGSDGNSIAVQTDEGAFLLDAGLNGKKLMELMDKVGVDGNDLSAILISHEHADHVRGAGVLSRRLNIPVMANANTFAQMNVGEIERSPFRTMDPFYITGTMVLPLPTSHDAVEPNAFLLRHKEKKILVATDTGAITPPLEAILNDVDLVIIESNYDEHMLKTGPYPPYLKKRIACDTGHLSNVACGGALKRSMGNGRKVFLAHLSKNNNTPDIARDTVARIMGVKRINIDCLEFPGDYRSIRVL